jgi:hypothetical protein
METLFRRMQVPNRNLDGSQESQIFSEVTEAVKTTSKMGAIPDEI